MKMPSLVRRHQSFQFVLQELVLHIFRGTFFHLDEVAGLERAGRSQLMMLYRGLG